jgi:hypothetical protein
MSANFAPVENRKRRLRRATRDKPGCRRRSEKPQKLAVAVVCVGWAMKGVKAICTSLYGYSMIEVHNGRRELFPVKERAKEL